MGRARLWDVPDLPEDPRGVATWVEFLTEMEIDGQGQVRTLDSKSWNERRERLRRQGGPLTTRDRWRLDPILFGPEPTARAKAWVDRGHWDQAEAAFTEAVAARPLDTAVLLERARFYTDRSRPEEAGADYARAYALGSRDPKLIDTIIAIPTLFRRVVASSPGAAAPLWASAAKIAPGWGAGPKVHGRLRQGRGARTRRFELLERPRDGPR